MSGGLVVRFLDERRRIGEEVASRMLEVEISPDAPVESLERVSQLIRDVMADAGSEALQNSSTVEIPGIRPAFHECNTRSSM